MRTPTYSTVTRGLTVNSLHAHLEPLTTTGLQLLVRTLPTDTFMGANHFCSLTGLPTPVCRAFIKHNVNVAWEAHQILTRREQIELATLKGSTPKEKATMPTRITKQQFYRVNRFIKDQREKRVYNADHIAKHFGISPESVRKIARTKTWPAFDAYNASKRKGTKLGRPFKTAASLPLPLTAPTTATELAEKQYTITITRAEYRKLIALEQRVEDLEAWRKNQLEAEKGLIALQVADLQQPRRRFWRKH